MTETVPLFGGSPLPGVETLAQIRSAADSRDPERGGMSAFGNSPARHQRDCPRSALGFPRRRGHEPVQFRVPGDGIDKGHQRDLYEMGESLRPTALVVTLEAIQNRVAANRKKGKYTWVFIDSGL